MPVSHLGSCCCASGVPTSVCLNSPDDLPNTMVLTDPSLGAITMNWVSANLWRGTATFDSDQLGQIIGSFCNPVSGQAIITYQLTCGTWVGSPGLSIYAQQCGSLSAPCGNTSRRRVRNNGILNITDSVCQTDIQSEAGRSFDPVDMEFVVLGVGKLCSAIDIWGAGDTSLFLSEP